MKTKMLVIILSLILATTGVFSQSGHNDIYFGYGVLSVQDWAEFGKAIAGSLGSAIGSGIVDAIGGPGTADALEHTTISGYGPICFGFRFGPSRRVKFGLIASYAHYNVEYEFESGKTARDSDHFITTMGRIDLYWMNRRTFALYSSGSAGICYYSSSGTSAHTEEETSSNDIFFAFQLNLIGIRLGGRVAFYLEFGFGYNGLLNGGLAFRL
jgi:hypothetical protein